MMQTNKNVASAAFILAGLTSIAWFMPFIQLAGGMYQSGSHLGELAYLLLVMPYVSAALLLAGQNAAASVFALMPMITACAYMRLPLSTVGDGLWAIVAMLVLQYHVALWGFCKVPRSVTKIMLFVLPFVFFCIVISLYLASEDLVTKTQYSVAFFIYFGVIGVLAVLAEEPLNEYDDAGETMPL